MNRYTLELRYIENNPNIDLFEEVKYYEPLELDNFKKKFFDRYKFRQIGFESVEMFKHFLRQTLNENYDFYAQLYETKLRCREIDFMLNKDLKETITREIESNSTGNTVGNSDIINSFLDTPSTKLSVSENLDKFLTNASKNINNSNANSNTSSTGKETNTLISQGNIGVTSSAELLTKWRETLINLDQMILDDLESLFMMIY